MKEQWVHWSLGCRPSTSSEFLSLFWTDLIVSATMATPAQVGKKQFDRNSSSAVTSLTLLTFWRLFDHSFAKLLGRQGPPGGEGVRLVHRASGNFLGFPEFARTSPGVPLRLPRILRKLEVDQTSPNVDPCLTQNWWLAKSPYECDPSTNQAKSRTYERHRGHGEVDQQTLRPRNSARLSIPQQQITQCLLRMVLPAFEGISETQHWEPPDVGLEGPPPSPMVIGGPFPQANPLPSPPSPSFFPPPPLALCARLRERAAQAGGGGGS